MIDREPSDIDVAEAFAAGACSEPEETITAWARSKPEDLADAAKKLDALIYALHRLVRHSLRTGGPDALLEYPEIMLAMSALHEHCGFKLEDFDDRFVNRWHGDTQ